MVTSRAILDRSVYARIRLTGGLNVTFMLLRSPTLSGYASKERQRERENEKYGERQGERENGLEP